MTQESRSAISRDNGAKSRGPVTHAGRKKSSRNALKHGFNSGNIVLLDCESRAEFKRILNEHFAMHQPVTAIETSLVHEIVATHWRIRRRWTIETALLNLAMFRRFAEDDKTAPSRVENLLATAFRNLVDDHSRAFQTLRELQQSQLKRKMTKRTHRNRLNSGQISMNSATCQKRGLSENEPNKPISRPKTTPESPYNLA